MGSIFGTLSLAVLSVQPPAPAFHGSAYAICGPEPLLECLQWADQCLRDAEAKGAEPDLAFEWCAEEVPPGIVHWSTQSEDFPWVR